MADKEYTIGPATIEWDPNGTTPVEFGLTTEDISLDYKINTTELKMSQTGDNPYDDIIKGGPTTVTTVIAESNLEKLVMVIPGARLITNATDTTKKRLVVSGKAGQSLRDLAKPLLIKPVVGGPEDEILIYLAAPVPEIQYVFGTDKVRAAKIVWKAYPDPTKNMETWDMGDQTA